MYSRKSPTKKKRTKKFSYPLLASVLFFTLLIVFLLINTVSITVTKDTQTAPGSNPPQIGIGGGPPETREDYLDEINALQGRVVQFQHIQIHRVVNNQLIWVGPDSQHEVLIMLPASFAPSSQKRQNPLVHAGSEIETLTGVIQKTPNQETLQKDWQLVQSQIDEVQQLPIYIQAVQIEFPNSSSI